jgi:hypothetical protein
MAMALLAAARPAFAQGDTAYDGVKNLVFAPSMRLACSVNDTT